MGAALINEYEAVLSRGALFKKCVLTAEEREELLDAFLSVCRWTRIYYLWRPNLPDDEDNQPHGRTRYRRIEKCRMF